MEIKREFKKEGEDKDINLDNDPRHLSPKEDLGKREWMLVLSVGTINLLQGQYASTPTLGRDPGKQWEV